MKWEEIYKQKLTSADEAVKKILSGNRVMVGHASGEPRALLEAMVQNKDAYENVEIVHMVPMGPAEYCRPEYDGHFRHNSLFAGASTRDAINAGRADFTCAHFSQIPGLIIKKYLPVDVCLCLLSPPDELGYCSFGVSVDYTKPSAEHSSIVIAEISPNMPRTLGNSFIHVSKLDYIVETETKPIPLQQQTVADNDKTIGMYCAELIKDGDCLQLGIGSIPDAVLHQLHTKKDLGIHTEMFSDGVIDLVELGVITCVRKNYHVGRMIATFLMGSERLYRYAHNNPMVEMHPVDYTNNPAIIARNNHMVSINSALQIDLMGQVVSDTIGFHQFSGSGGQADFVRGAAWSMGGCSILAFPSTAGQGKISRIVSHLDEGASVTTTRTDVQYIVTEFGIADLRGKSLQQRAKSLIQIAHPYFRDDLRRNLNKKSE